TVLGERDRSVGGAALGGRGGRELLPVADRVVGDEADHPAGERRQVGLPRGAEGAGDRAERLDGAAGGGHARGHVAAPVRLAVLLGEDGAGPRADDRPAGGLALAGGFEQEGAAGPAVGGEPAVERDRGVLVG